MNRVIHIAAACVCVLAGCATAGERVDIAIPGPSASVTSPRSVGTGPRVVVKPFDDARAERTHLGSRSHLWGSISYFDLRRGTAGEAIAKSLVQQLNRRGWQASLAVQDGSAQPDATISGTILDLSVNAISTFGRTEVAVKNTMMVRVANHIDESTIQERLLGSGTDEIFWFDPEDAEQLVNEVLEKNIEKFLADTKVEGRAVRLR